MSRHPLRRPAHARGSALIEALVSVALLAVAGFAAARLQPPLYAGTDAARLGFEAMLLAELDLEQTRGDDGILGSMAASAAAMDRMAAFRVARTVSADADPLARSKTVSVRVDWSDRADGAQHLTLDTVIASADTSLGGALWLARTAPVSLPVDGRAPSIPRGSRRLADGTSLVALSDDGGTVLRVDDSDGHVVAVCSTDLARRVAITPSDLATCTPARGLLLSGRVRFDGRDRPDPLSASDPARRLGMRLTLTAGGDPASPPTCASASDAAGTSVSYRCVAYTGLGRTWSGSLALIPIGWTLGALAGQQKVCRDSADQDGSGAVDQNAEHPPTYTAVTENLTQQNFLVIRGDVRCPAGTAP